MWLKTTYEQKMNNLKAINWPGIALPKVRAAVANARVDRDRNQKQVDALTAVQFVRDDDHEARAKNAHAAMMKSMLVTALILLTLFGIGAQALIYGIFMFLSVPSSLLAGAITDCALVAVFATVLYVSLSRLYSWERGYSYSLRVAAWIGVPIALATAVLVFSRVASPQAAAALLASNAITYSLFIVAEFTPALISAVAAALRFSKEPEIHGQRLEELAAEMKAINEFISWAQSYADKLQDALARHGSVGENGEADGVKTTRDRPLGSHMPVDRADTHPGNSGLGKLTIIVFCLLALGTSVQSAQAQADRNAGLKCSIAIGGIDSVDAGARDEFVKQTIDNASTFAICRELRLTLFDDRGRFSTSVVYYPKLINSIPDCKNPPPLPNSDRIASVLIERVRGFLQNAEEDAKSACQARVVEIQQHDAEAVEDMKDAIRKTFHPSPHQGPPPCVDAISGLTFIADEQPDVVLVASHFAANCTAFSWLWKPIQLRLPHDSHVAFVALPSRGDVRLEGEAALARVNLWKRYNGNVIIKVPSELTSTFFKELVR
jgi:hypothetical protein